MSERIARLTDAFLAHWLGLVLTTAGVVATIWLAVTGQLALYIHPRYDVFTVIMAVLGGVGIIGAIFALRRPDGPAASARPSRPRRGRARESGSNGELRHDRHGHDRHGHDRHGHDRHNQDPHGHHDHGHHDHDRHDHGHHDHDRHDHGQHSHAAPTPMRRRVLPIIGAALVCVGTVGALLVLPPATLTTSTVDQRDMNSSAIDLDGEPIQLAGVDTADFTVRDWSQLLAQGADPTYFTGMQPELLGFVTPDPEGTEDVFYVARFVVTCCAVDAQPVGVPVYMPGWQDQFDIDSWVEVTGAFVTNPADGGAHPVVLEPASSAATSQPANPYIT